MVGLVVRRETHDSPVGRGNVEGIEMRRAGMVDKASRGLVTTKMVDVETHTHSHERNLQANLGV
jgi:hypothetical protein